MAREINPKDTSRAMAFELWMQAPNPMVTFFKTIDVTNLIRISKKKHLKFNMLLDYCIGKAAVDVKEFYLLPVGVGKTHMAIAAGVKACNLGYKTKFYTVTELVLKLAEARKNGTLEKLLRELRGLDLLILDEWGYVPVDKDGSQLLFRVISDSYESKSLILTTNLEFSKWGGIFTDDQMAAAMIDRLVHHGHLLIFEGKSYRMEHALMRRDA